MSDPDETNQFGDDDAQSHDEREVTPLPGVAEAEAVERAEAEENSRPGDQAQSHDEREVTPLPGVAEAEAVERAEAEENDSSEDEDDQKDPAGFLAQGLVAGPPDIHH